MSAMFHYDDVMFVVAVLFSCVLLCRVVLCCVVLLTSAATRDWHGPLCSWRVASRRVSAVALSAARELKVGAQMRGCSAVRQRRMMHRGGIASAGASPDCRRHSRFSAAARLPSRFLHFFVAVGRPGRGAAPVAARGGAWRRGAAWGGILPTVCMNRS